MKMWRSRNRPLRINNKFRGYIICIYVSPPPPQPPPPPAAPPETLSPDVLVEFPTVYTKNVLLDDFYVDEDEPIIVVERPALPELHAMVCDASWVETAFAAAAAATESPLPEEEFPPPPPPRANRAPLIRKLIPPPLKNAEDARAYMNHRGELY